MLDADAWAPQGAMEGSCPAKKQVVYDTSNTHKHKTRAYRNAIWNDNGC
ncbi:MAG: hypothetical protein H6735_19195 [Alphaproteobacteria bacterium]|nr:hypothetical protein [Alphaproteobacteria bacterium]